MSPGDEKRSGFPRAVWGWVLAWVVLAVVAVIWGVPNEENDLTDRAGGLIEGSELQVDFNGRDASITGMADQATIDAAEDAVYDLRGVRRVDVSGAQAAAPTTTTTTTEPPVTTTTATPETTTTAAPELDNPSFAALQTDGLVELWGILPNQASIDSIEAAATDVYGADNITSRMEIGEVADADYLAHLPQLFGVAEGLNPWEFSLDNGEVAFSGLGPDREAVADLRDEFRDYVEPAQFAGAEVALEVDPDAVAAAFTDLLAGGANFESGSAVLSAEAEAKLDDIIEIMNENPSTVLTVEGHTDSQGDAAANLTLSEERAQAVVDYLVAGGIDADRLTAIGYGEERPIASNDNPEGRAQNRRIEFVVTEGE